MNDQVYLQQLRRVLLDALPQKPRIRWIPVNQYVVELVLMVPLSVH